MTRPPASPLRFAPLIPLLAALVLGACSGPSHSRSVDWFTRNEETRRALAEVKHQTPPEKRDERAQEELLRIQRFFESLPPCASQDLEASVEVGRLPPSPGDGEVRVRGFLATTGGACNLGSCTSGVPGAVSSRCCNECRGGSWFVSAPGVAPANVVVLGGEAPASDGAGWEVMDCTVDELHDNVPLREVVVRGSVRRWESSPTDSYRPKSWRMHVSQLCVLESPSARLFGKDVTRASLPR